MYKHEDNVYPFGKHDLVQKRKTRKKIKSKLVFMVVFIAFVFSLLLFLRSPYFTIEEIIVDGAEEISREEIHMSMEITEGMNIWRVTPGEIRERIYSSIPRVKEVKVERLLPDKLYIEIEENYAQALVSYDGEYLELTHEGVVMGVREEYDEGLPVVNGLNSGILNVGAKIQNEQRKKIIQLFMQKYHECSLPVKKINVEDPQNIVLYTREGMEVKMGDAENLSRKFELLPPLYSQIGLWEKGPSEGYIDLSTAEAPVFKPF